MRIVQSLPHLLICVLLVTRAQAQWTYWDPAIGGNAHYYKAVAEPDAIGWSDAQAAAVAEGGYLATLTSADENDFVFSLVDDPSFWSDLVYYNGLYFGPWIGGRQTPGSPEPAGGWEWLTGEPFSYTNWAPGQPNNSGGSQDYLHLVHPSPGAVATWNDVRESGGDDVVGDVIVGYVIESLIPEPTTLSLLALGGLALLRRRR